MSSLAAMSPSAATGHDVESSAPLGHGAIRAVVGRGAALLASASRHAARQPAVHSAGAAVSLAAEDCRRQRHRHETAAEIFNMDIAAAVSVLRKRAADRSDRT